MWEGPIHTQPVWLSGLRWLYHITDSQHEHSSPRGHLMIHFFRTGHLLISDWPSLTLFKATSHVKENWTECLRTRQSFSSKKKLVNSQQAAWQRWKQSAGRDGSMLQQVWREKGCKLLGSILVFATNHSANIFTSAKMWWQEFQKKGHHIRAE